MKNLGNTIEKAVAFLTGEATCVLYRTEEDMQISREKGIRPLVLWMAEDENALRDELRLFWQYTAVRRQCTEK